jgi:hypothetical protein
VIPDPAAWEQRGNGWYKITDKRSKNAYYLRPCENCGTEALMQRRQRFCSLSCSSGRADRIPTGSAHGNWRGDDVTYEGRHSRVERARGKASEHPCADCGETAKDWSQIHGTTGLEPEHYEPRCAKCHSQYDIDTQPRGERHGNTKLTDAQRRAVIASVGATGRELAKHFEVSDSAISQIRKTHKRGA